LRFSASTPSSTGASLIVVTGTSKDGARLEVAKKLGADHVIDVEKEDPLARIMAITGNKGVDVALDCTAGAGTFPACLQITVCDSPCCPVPGSAPWNCSRRRRRTATTRRRSPPLRVGGRELMTSNRSAY
jgi:hypothetical protein